jgi:hypothetical protein
MEFVRHIGFDQISNKYFFEFRFIKYENYELDFPYEEG